MAARLDKQIEEIIAEENPQSQPRKERSRPESEGGYAMTIDEKILSDDFGNNKGKLPLPPERTGNHHRTLWPAEISGTQIRANQQQGH